MATVLLQDMNAAAEASTLELEEDSAVALSH